MNWRVKGLIQKALSHIPCGTRLNDLLQRTVGELRDFDREVAGKVSDWSIVMSYLDSVGFELQGARCLEIGTGWFPTLPICFALSGAGLCSTYDLSRHLSTSLTFQFLGLLERHLPAIAKAAAQPVPKIEGCFQQLKAANTVDDLLRIARVDYQAPADATATSLPSESVDLVYSNSVLEHVSPEGIQAMMRESYRVLRPGGIAVHGVNCGDHYAYFDRRITAINYLTYSERSWRFWNNKLLYQNRLRPQDLLELAIRAGFKVALEKRRARPELLAALPGLQIASEFRHYPPEQLCCTSIDFVARKP